MVEKDNTLYPVGSYTSGSLYSIAKKAYERTKGGKSDQEPGKQDAFISIIFSAASLEAFINELPERTNSTISKVPKEIRTLQVVMKEVELSRGSIILKYMLTKIILDSGKPYDKGSPPFQDFQRLIRLRDTIIHTKPITEFATDANNKFVRVHTPKILKDMPKLLLADFNEGVVAHWQGRISTQAMARWACNTTVSMVQSIYSILPDGEYKKHVISGKVFSPVE